MLVRGHGGLQSLNLLHWRMGSTSWGFWPKTTSPGFPLWVKAPLLPGFSRNQPSKRRPKPPKTGLIKTSLQLKMMHFFLVKRVFFSFPFSFLDIESSSNFGGQQKMLLKVLWEFTLNFPHPHWQNNPIYGTGEMEKSRRKTIKNM